MRAEAPVDSDVRDQVVLKRRVYNQIATSVSIEELTEQANATGAYDKDLVRFAEIDEGQRILEVGSGLGHLSMALAKTGR
ncbi:MAG: hypothetical protein R2873_13385 [Caldilineaceae bacterium]